MQLHYDYSRTLSLVLALTLALTLTLFHTSINLQAKNR